MLSLVGGREREALELINKSIDQQGTVPDLLDTRGLVYISLGRPDDAVKDLEESVVLNPSAATRFHLALAYLESNHRKEAAEAFAEATRTGLSSESLHPLERPSFDASVRPSVAHDLDSVRLRPSEKSTLTRAIKVPEHARRASHRIARRNATVRESRDRMDASLWSLTLLVLGLRIVAIGAESFWFDEAFRPISSAHSYRSMVSGGALDIGNPPFYYLVLRMWSRVIRPIRGRSSQPLGGLRDLDGASAGPARPTPVHAEDRTASPPACSRFHRWPSSSPTKRDAMHC